MEKKIEIMRSYFAAIGCVNFSIFATDDEVINEFYLKFGNILDKDIN